MMDWFLKNSIEFSGMKIIFPFYHIVSDEDCPHVKHLYPIKRIAKFEEELDFLQKHYLPISLEELTNHIQNKTQPKNPSFFLTFDDGLRECYTIIAPILKRRKIPAAFFLNTGFVGNKDLFFRYKVSLLIEAMSDNPSSKRVSERDLLKLTYHDSKKIDELAKELNFDFNEFLQREKPYMNWEEIMELKDQGFFFGGHSVDHPLYNGITLTEQIKQTRESTESIQKRLDLVYRIFAFPFTDYGVKKSFFEKVYNDNLCELTFGTAGLKEDEFSRNIQRLSMDNCLCSARKFFHKELIYYQLKRFINKQKVIHPK